MHQERIVYEKTQFGLTSVLIIAAVMGFVFFVSTITDEPRPILVATEVIAALVAVPALTMTIRVTPTALEWWLTLGFMRRRMPLADIIGLQPWQTTFINGFGYRVSDTGALWRVSGSKAVLFDLADGRRLGLGTDEPDRLIAAVKPLLPSDPVSSRLSG